MLKKLLHNTTLGLAVLAAIFGGVYCCSNAGTPSGSGLLQQETQSPDDLYSSPSSVVSVRAYLRSDAPVETGSVNWVFRVTCFEKSLGSTCDFVPADSVENIEFSDPDGSRYYLAVLHAQILIRNGSTRPASALASSVSKHFADREDSSEQISTYVRPTILLDAELTTEGLDVTWTTLNMDEDDVQVMFKVVDIPESLHSPSCRSLSI